MHKITSRVLTKDDFTVATNTDSIKYINQLIIEYSDPNQFSTTKQEVFNKIISNLPSGYLKWMGISTNYLQLKTIWNQRCSHKHKLDEWRVFGEFIKSLPMSEMITG